MSNFTSTLFATLFSSLIFLGTFQGRKIHERKKTEPVKELTRDYLFPDIPIAPVDTPPRPENPNAGPEDPTMSGDYTPLTFENPSNVEVVFEMAPDGSGYYIHERVGGVDIKPPSFITFEEYLEYRKNKGVTDYWREKTLGNNDVRSGPALSVNPGVLSSVFGDCPIEIRPNGTALLEFSGQINKTKNPNLSIRQQRNANFNFEQQIQLNVVGKVGCKLRLNANWDTEATFDFENQFKVEYTGDEDEIIKKIEAGNVSLPLNGSLIQGGQNLFGIKLQMQFGPVTVTSIASQQRGKTENITVKGGSQVTEFKKKANEYDEYRHFFLAHYFRNRYETALANLPAINSGFQITRMEVWVTNNNNSSTQNNRNAIGFIDLSENEMPTGGSQGRLFNQAINGIGTSYPDNDNNSLWTFLQANPAYREKSTAVTAIQTDSTILNLTNGQDYELVENMRLLNPNEYSYHPQLGYISLNTQLQANQVLYVSYEYQYNGKTYQVGEFSNDVPANEYNSNVLFLKMLKPSSVKPTYNNQVYPTWDLMMKNIYNIGGYGLRPDNFQLQIVYQSGSSAGDLLYLPDGSIKNKPLVQVMELDNLTNNIESGADNKFDFIEGITINPERGLIIFPVLEPFGGHLVNLMGNAEDSAKYAFTQLYNMTRMDAIQQAQHVDRYFLTGEYQGASSSEISLNQINIAQGSVRVTAGGTQLQEGIDYTVDYNIGKVTIINPGILTSGQEVNVSFETNTLFGIESKTLVGTHVDYFVNEDIQLGGTILHLAEKPLTPKINIGDEPISNTIWGLDGTLRKDSRFLTKLIDKIPLLSTKEISTITANFEFAQLLPGHPRVIKVNGEDGIAYLDDFEGAKTEFDLSGQRNWKIASFPGNNGFNNLYVPPTDTSGRSSNYSRAKLNWYAIDPNFYSTQADVIDEDLDPNNHYTRQVNPTEVFPNLTAAAGENLLRTFDLWYQPSKRGMYNYEADPSRVNPDGSFAFPRDNWGGIMRRTTGNTDFEASNFEFIEFWILDPFIYDSTSGELYLDLGKVSEDVLPDNFRSFENGLPTNATERSIVTQTQWGDVPLTNPPTNAFNNEEASREFQDVGFDGLRDADEQTFFADFLAAAGAFMNASALDALRQDPSSDNFKHFFDENVFPDGTPLLDRYRDFNGLDGNSPLGNDDANFSLQGSPTPDTEDLNVNGTLNTTEEYYEYRLKISPQDLVVGQNYVVDKIPADINLPNGSTERVNWYQFRIPLSAGVPINNIQNFKSIDFIRMYMTGFDEEVIVRMAKFQLVATQWRSYKNFLGDENETVVGDPAQTTFEIATVNVEENSAKQPFNYVLPPNIERVNQINSTQPGLLQNEQSLVMKACDLLDGDARGAFKVVSYDLRAYKDVKMWVHAEQPAGVQNHNFNNRGDVRAFIRIGSDNSDNYYEYEIPLTPSTVGDNSRENVWLAENQFDFPMEVLNVAKSARNQQQAPTDVRFMYVDPETGNRIFVKGTPKLSDVKSIMIGIRNPKGDGSSSGPLCAEVWFNELRVTNFNERSGYAANARINIKGADFFNITLSGSRLTPGFGGIDSKVNNRSREDVYRYDVAGSFAIGKFFPSKWGLEIPLYLTYGEQFTNPEFNPLESDVLTTSFLESVNPDERDSVQKAIQDYKLNRSISINNMRKIRMNPQAKTHFWDVENLSFTVAYNERFERNHLIQSRNFKNHQAGITYNYNFNPKLYQPFKGKGTRKNPITEFNFYLLPKSVSVSVRGDRQFEHNQIRPAANGLAIDPTYYKNFGITRTYNMRWDFTRSLSMTYSATNQSRVDEDKDAEEIQWDRIMSFGKGIDSVELNGRDTVFIRDNMINFGRNVNFNQNIGLNYQLPFDKYPWTNWLSGNIGYQAGLTWQRAPDNNRLLGNTLGNSQTKQAQARVSLSTLYNKIPALRKIMQQSQPKPQQGGKPPVQNPDAKPGEEEPKDDTYKFLAVIGKEIARVLLSIQSVDAQWQQTRGTILPGYMPQTDNFGFDWGYVERDSNLNVIQQSPVIPPSVGFILGYQPDTNWLNQHAPYGWFSKDPTLSNPFAQTFQEQITGRTSVTLFRDFRVDLQVNKSRGTNYSENYRFDTTTNSYYHYNVLETGNYSISSIFAFTALEPNSEDSKAFQEFENYTRIISGRLASENPNYEKFGLTQTSQDYANGYNISSQEVLIPAFLSAYGVYNPKRINLTPFPKVPLPNWNVNYNGLSKIKLFQKWFSSVTITHGYRGVYSVGSYTSNVDFFENEGFSDSLDVVGTDPVNGITLYNFRPENIIQTVSITEQFAPLAKLTLNFKNGVTSSVEYRTTRNLTLNTGNLQLTETRTKDFTFSFGWRKDKLNWEFYLFGRQWNLKNSLNARLDVSMRDTKTRNRQLDSEVNPDFTGGNFNLSLKPSIDYVINQRLNIQLFFEKSINKPAISTSFPSSFTAMGIRVRFTLTN